MHSLISANNYQLHPKLPLWSGVDWEVWQLQWRFNFKATSLDTHHFLCTYNCISEHPLSRLSWANPRIEIGTWRHREQFRSIFLLLDFFYGNIGRDIPSEWVHWKVRSMGELAPSQPGSDYRCLCAQQLWWCSRAEEFSLWALSKPIFNYVASTRQTTPKLAQIADTRI